MKHIVTIFVLLFLSKSFFAQRDEAIRDTTVAGKLFHVIMYNESNHVACVGQFIPNTFIRAGEWDYFFADGKIRSKTFFKMDYKTGVWIYYDECGNIIKKESHRKKILFADSNIKPIASVYYDDLQQDEEARQKAEDNIKPYVLDMWVYDVFRYIDDVRGISGMSRSERINALSPFSSMNTQLYNNRPYINVTIKK